MHMRTNTTQVKEKQDNKPENKLEQEVQFNMVINTTFTKMLENRSHRLNQVAYTVGLNHQLSEPPAAVLTKGCNCDQ